MQREALRIIDANYNRAREGIRVCEDILRFALNKTELALELKKSRHRLSVLIESLDRDTLLKSRDTLMDKAKFRYSSGRKSDYKNILSFNFKRTTEALRVLEEIVQMLKPDLKSSFMRLRFKIYKIESEAVL